MKDIDNPCRLGKVKSHLLLFDSLVTVEHISIRDWRFKEEENVQLIYEYLPMT